MTDRLALELLGGPPSGKAVVRMTSKGPSHVDLESPAPATSRRGLLGALGAAGLASAAALAISRPVSAAPPTSPTADDRELLREAMRFELAAGALYKEAVAAGLPDEVTELAAVFAENHISYADEMAGIAGLSANAMNDDIFEQFSSTFATDDVAAFAEAAIDLENTAAATHTALLADYVSVNARTTTAAIVVVEARMATVLTHLNDSATDLDDVFEPDAEPLTLTGGAS
jgi:hypothetical protein